MSYTRLCGGIHEDGIGDKLGFSVPSMPIDVEFTMRSAWEAVLANSGDSRPVWEISGTKCLMISVNFLALSCVLLEMVSD